MKRDLPRTVNMDDLAAKRRLMTYIGTLRGLYDVTVTPRKRTRTLNQNAYYFAAFVQPFSEYLTREWGEAIDIDQAHITLKIAVLGMKQKVNKETGEVLEMVPTSRFKDTWEFSEYLEHAAKFLAETASIVVLPPELFFDEKQKLRKVG